MKGTIAAAGCWVLGSMVAAADVIIGELDPLIVAGRGEGAWWGARELQAGVNRQRMLDGGALLERTPGAAVVRNGSQTGIVQVRGVSGDRVRVLVDGMTLTPACPNHMDPPLHYAEAGEDMRVDLMAGVSPVSFGGDSLGAVVRVMPPEPRFADEGSDEVSGDMGAIYRGSHDAFGATAKLRYQTAGLAAAWSGGWSTADDLRFPGGRARATGFDTMRSDLRMAVRTETGYVAVDGGLTRTRDAGTPALPMDMIRDDSWHVGLRHKTRRGADTVETRVYVHDIDHLMTNYTLRPAAMRMEAPATSRDYGIRSVWSRDTGAGAARLGVDVHRNDFDADQVNVMSGARRDTFADNRRERIGVFAEWEDGISDAWTVLAGIRGDHVNTRAGRVRPGFGPPQVAADAAAFNAGDRRHDDFLVDAMAALRFEPDEKTTWELAVAMNNRAPSLVERYLWTPLNASAGLADGRRYKGNVDLDPETSFQVSGAVERRGAGWELRFSPFLQYVDDYIQGRPDSGGGGFLQFQNLDRARIYGADFEARHALTEGLTVSGFVSCVRGRDMENNDNLYRIAPLRGLVDLEWAGGPWEAHLECEWADAQDDTAAFNGEPATPGYGLWHVRLARELDVGARVELGVENVFDKRYADHLAGINRVEGSDVAVGQRMPGAGRFLYATVGWEY